MSGRKTEGGRERREMESEEREGSGRERGKR